MQNSASYFLSPAERIDQERRNYLAIRIEKGITETDEVFAQFHKKLIHEGIMKYPVDLLQPLFENWFQPSFLAEFDEAMRRANDETDIKSHMLLVSVHIVDRIKLALTLGSNYKAEGK